jgi:hypothetical protein
LDAHGRSSASIAWVTECPNNSLAYSPESESTTQHSAIAGITAQRVHTRTRWAAIGRDVKARAENFGRVSSPLSQDGRQSPRYRFDAGSWLNFSRARWIGDHPHRRSQPSYFRVPSRGRLLFAQLSSTNGRPCQRPHINYRLVPRIVNAGNSLLTAAISASSGIDFRQWSLSLHFGSGEKGKLMAAFGAAIRAGGLSLSQSAVICRLGKKTLRDLGRNRDKASPICSSRPPWPETLPGLQRSPRADGLRNREPVRETLRGRCAPASWVHRFSRLPRRSKNHLRVYPQSRAGFTFGLLAYAFGMVSEASS